MKSTSETLSVLAPEWKSSKPRSAQTTLTSSKTLDTSNGLENMINPKLFPNSNFPSYSDQSVVVNEIAPVEERQTSHQTLVWGEQGPLPKASDLPGKKNPNNLHQNAHALRANKEKLEYV